MHSSLAAIFDKAKETPGIIALPESRDERVVQAAQELANSKLAFPVLIANSDTIDNLNDLDGFIQCSLDDLSSSSNAKNGGVIVNMDLADNSDKLQQLKQEHLNKNLDEPLTPITVGAMLLSANLVDGMIAGATCPTATVIRAGIKLVGLAPQTKTVSSCFLMLADDEPLIFADCAIVPQPNPEQLADIAIASADIYQKLCGKSPKVAMLSFSTKGSAKHRDVDKVQKALSILGSRNPDFEYDGELQFDAAIDKAVAKSKAPSSSIAGSANVFIFPDLNSANIGYKIAQRLGGIPAIGPLIMGLKYPLMDLSRGCSSDDITTLGAITSVMTKC